MTKTELTPKDKQEEEYALWKKSYGHEWEEDEKISEIPNRENRDGEV